MLLENKKIIIIGGSSGIGFATAKLACQEGAEVIIASRSKEKLIAAQKRMDQSITIKQLDFQNHSELKDFFEEIGSFDHLQIPASDLKTGPFLSFPAEEAMASFQSKFWGPYFTAKYAYPYINKSENASITLYSGAFSQRPIYHGAAIAAAINGAIEGLVRALAVELAPVRINALSPGLTITEHLTNNYSAEELKKLSENFSTQLIIKRPGQPEEIARTAIYLMTSTYTTGSTLFTDGGFTLI